MLNGEEVYYREAGYYPDADEIQPGDGFDRVLLKWPDGSAFMMEFYLSPKAWADRRQSGAATFYGAVNKLIREGFEEGDGFIKPPFYFGVSEVEGVSIVAEGEDQPAPLPTVLRVLADLIDRGKLD